MNTKQQIELSERLRLACLEKGISEPRFVAQDEDGEWYHYEDEPLARSCTWNCSSCEFSILQDKPNEQWRETLMEFITPKIEVGKRYWRRDGSVSGEITRVKGAKLYIFSDGINWYKPDGIWQSNCISNFDLIAEYREELQPEKVSLQEAVKLITESAEENRRIVMEYFRKICEND